MFLIAKMGLVTCAFYVGIAALIEAALYWLNFKAWAPIFGIVWFASFASAWRLIVAPIVAKFAR